MNFDRLLIDGPSLGYRCFHALARHPLRTSWGLDVGASFVFARILWNYLQTYQPECAVIAWDRGAAHRLEVLETYKQDRPPTPDALNAQWPIMRAVAEAMGYRHAEVEGYEADDVIATLTRRWKTRQRRVLVVTSDKDLLQLVDGSRVFVLDPRGKEDVLYTPEEVEKRFGVPPTRLREYLALVGDAVDGIPGVPGVGPKRALQILETVPDLEALEDHLFRIRSARLRAQLHAHRDQIRQALSLVQLVEVPDLPEDALCPRGEVQRDRLSELFRQFEFFSLLEEIAPEAPRVEPHSTEIPREGGVVLREGSVYVGKDNAYWMADRLPEGEWVAFDAKEVWKVYPDATLSGDLSLAAYLLEPGHGRYDPSFVFLAYQGLRVDPEDPGQHAALTWLLYPRFVAALKSLDLWRLYTELELPLARILAEMERTGIHVDVPTLHALRQELQTALHDLEVEIHALAGEPFNLCSPRQLSRILFEKLGLKPIKRTKTGYSTDASVLEQLAREHPLPARLLAYREMEKMLSTYVQSYLEQVDPATSRLYPIYDQKATATGRIAARSPNLQTIPVRSRWADRIREAFRAPEGAVLIAADYSQVELRILAHLSEDPVLIQAFAEGRDIHRETAARLFQKSPEQVTSEERRVAKVVNFGIIYGMTEFGLSRELGISRDEARAFIEAYRQHFPGVMAWTEAILVRAEKEGEVRTLLGRRRVLPRGMGLSRADREALGRIAINTPVQGSAADLIKRAMLEIRREVRKRGLQGRMVLQIHDELVFEVPRAEQDIWLREIVPLMERVMSLRVPLQVDVQVGESLRDL